MSVGIRRIKKSDYFSRKKYIIKSCSVEDKTYFIRTDKKTIKESISHDTWTDRPGKRKKEIHKTYKSMNADPKINILGEKESRRKIVSGNLVIQAVKKGEMKNLIDGRIKEEAKSIYKEAKRRNNKF